MDIRTRYFEVHASRYNIGIGSGASVWFRLFGYGIFARVTLRKTRGGSTFPSAVQGRSVPNRPACARPGHSH